MALTLKILGCLSRLILATALVCVLPALGSDETIRADVRHATATAGDSDDPEVAALTLRCDLRLTNWSPRPVDVPKTEGGDGATRVAILGLQSKQPDGSWAYGFQSSWYDAGKVKYVPCVSLPPRGVTEFGNFTVGLLLLRKQLSGLGERPLIRLNIMVMCRERDGKVLTRTATTDAFELRRSTQR